MKRIYQAVGVAAICGLILTAGSCDDNTPDADSDSAQNYASGSKVDVDQKTYVITGEVVREVNSLTRQVSPARKENSSGTTGTRVAPSPAPSKLARASFGSRCRYPIQRLRKLQSVKSRSSRPPTPR